VSEVVSRIAGVLVHRPHVTAVRQQVLAAVRQYHAGHPLEDGMPREELRERLFGSAAPGVFEQTLDGLAAENEIIARDRVALRSHTLALTDEEARVRDVLVATLDRGDLTPLAGADLVAHVGAPKEVVDRLATLLVRQKVLVRAGDLLFHQAALDRLKRAVRSLKQEQQTDRIDVAAFKERYQVSRKYAIPLLEYLDRERVTRRVGDVRQIV
jgi:selenocysteine-specific elongation factor